MSPELDYMAPDYAAIFGWRLRRLEDLRAEPYNAEILKKHYKWHPWDFVSDWGITVDPRNPEVGQPALVPFILFPKQVDWMKWVFESWQERRPGVTIKSRELGVSWLAIALSCALCLHWDGVAIGFGSRKLELVDKLGDPDSLFWKAREFMAHLPHEFRGGWTRDLAPEKRIMFPRTGSTMTGEGGDEIGRGGRKSIYFVDEASKLPRPMLAEASLSATTNCRMDIGTANGIGGPFYAKVHTWDAERVFRFHWRDDPRKDDEWYAKQVKNLDPVVLAQEVDIDFTASMEGVIIASAWIQAAVGFDAAMGLHPVGDVFGALDVADEGGDMCAFVGAKGHTIQHAEEWSGKGGDVHMTTVRAFGLCDDLGYTSFRYDADGIGSGVRGAARVTNEARLKAGQRRLRVVPYRGSAAVYEPDKRNIVLGRKNEDFFDNMKAQAWWTARLRFYNTWRVRSGAAPLSEFKTDQLVSIDPDIPVLAKLTAQLGQPTFSLNNSGQVVVDKAPDGAKSPDLGDAAIIRLARLPAVLEVADEAVTSSQVATRRAAVMARGRH